MATTGLSNIPPFVTTSSLGPKPNHSAKLQYTITDNIAQDAFVRLANASGEADNVQGAITEPKRLPYMVQPKHFSIVAKDESHPDEIQGLIQGTNFGEYAYIDQLMVDPKVQQSGVGTKLVKDFKTEIEQENGGPTSVFTLSEDHTDTETSSHQFWTNRGFKPLPNAIVLSRGESVKTRTPSQPQ